MHNVRTNNAKQELVKPIYPLRTHAVKGCNYRNVHSPFLPRDAL